MLMATSAGLEPATHGLEGRCSNPAELRSLISLLRSKMRGLNHVQE